jgi:hypothetical protein
VADFEEAGMAFSTRDLSLKAGVSSKTLYNHTELWKPAQGRLFSGRLAAALPEYNAVVGANSSEIGALPQCQEKITPPGLLAARRIVHEIKMRATRDKLDYRNMRRRGWRELDNSWRKEIEKITPVSFVQCDTRKLRAVLAVYLASVPRSPDEESELWLRGLVAELREELETRPKQLHLVMSNFSTAEKALLVVAACDSISGVESGADLSTRSENFKRLQKVRDALREPG